MIDKDGKSKERYLFLFKARILVCKVRRISEDRSVFVLKDIIRVSDFFRFIHTIINLKIFLFSDQKLEFYYIILIKDFFTIEKKHDPLFYKKKQCYLYVII